MFILCHCCPHVYASIQYLITGFTVSPAYPVFSTYSWTLLCRSVSKLFKYGLNICLLFSKYLSPNCLRFNFFNVLIIDKFSFQFNSLIFFQFPTIAGTNIVVHCLVNGTLTDESTIKVLSNHYRLSDALQI
jgi:hypothetical protein